MVGITRGPVLVRRDAISLYAVVVIMVIYTALFVRRPPQALFGRKVRPQCCAAGRAHGAAAVAYTGSRGVTRYMSSRPENARWLWGESARAGGRRLSDYIRLMSEAMLCFALPSRQATLYGAAVTYR